LTLADFDGLQSDQSLMSLGKDYVSKDSNLTMPLGSLIALSYKMKEITNALEGAGTKPIEAEGSQKVTMMSQTNMYVLCTSQWCYLGWACKPFKLEDKFMTWRVGSQGVF